MKMTMKLISWTVNLGENSNINSNIEIVNVNEMNDTFKRLDQPLRKKMFRMQSRKLLVHQSYSTEARWDE